MMEYQALIKIGRATLKVLFTDGSLTALGQNPAKYTTSDFLVQHAIENSSDFKRGRITVVSSVELDEDVRIERNPVKEEENAPADNAETGDTEEPETSADADDASADDMEEAEAETEATEETATPEVKTEVEFADNQEAKDYLTNNFGAKASSMKNREEIKAVGATYGVTITFANEQ